MRNETSYTVRYRYALAGCLFAALTACAGGTGPMPNTQALPPAAMTDIPNAVLGEHIEHVVIMVQENRTVDNLFQNFPGADTVAKGLMSDGYVYSAGEERSSEPGCLGQQPHRIHGRLRQRQNGRLEQSLRERRVLSEMRVSIRQSGSDTAVLDDGQRLRPGRPYVPDGSQRQFHRASRYHPRQRANQPR